MHSGEDVAMQEAIAYDVFSIIVGHTSHVGGMHAKAISSLHNCRVCRLRVAFLCHIFMRKLTEPSLNPNPNPRENAPSRGVSVSAILRK